MRPFKPLLSSDPTPPSLELTEDRLRRRISLNLAAAIVLTGFMALVTWETKRMASEESDCVVHTYSVMGALDVTLLHLFEVSEAECAFALTGQDDLLTHHESAKVAGYNLGANSFIQKPVDFDQFRAIVKTIGLYWLVINQSPVVADAARLAGTAHDRK